MQNPEISGIEYQQGELQGYEVNLNSYETQKSIMNHHIDEIQKDIVS